MGYGVNPFYAFGNRQTRLERPAKETKTWTASTRLRPYSPTATWVFSFRLASLSIPRVRVSNSTMCNSRKLSVKGKNLCGIDLTQPKDVPLPPLYGFTTASQSPQLPSAYACLVHCFSSAPEMGMKRDCSVEWRNAGILFNPTFPFLGWPRIGVLTNKKEGICLSFNQSPNSHRLNSPWLSFGAMISMLDGLSLLPHSMIEVWLLKTVGPEFKKKSIQHQYMTISYVIMPSLGI